MDFLDEEGELYEEKYLLAETIFENMKEYCTFHGLDFLSNPSSTNIYDLINLM